MGNAYFQFKQFRVLQEKAAMKVTTDACLFGSLFKRLLQENDYAHNVLDIGTGTGLLSLMYAQQFPGAAIDAVEIDHDAFEEAGKNFAVSGWSERLNAIEADIKNFTAAKRYDTIICNPPFYENILKSPNQQRNKALHDDGITLSELIFKIDELIKEDGAFLVLLPYHRSKICKDLAAQKGWFCTREFLIKQTERHSYFRAVMKFEKTKLPLESTEIIIRQNDTYSNDFIQLLQPFYLAL